MNFIAEIQKLQNYLKVQDYKTVVDGCEKLINKFPHNPFLFNLQGLALHGSGKYLIAIDRYNPNHQSKREIALLYERYISNLSLCILYIYI